MRRPFAFLMGLLALLGCRPPGGSGEDEAFGPGAPRPDDPPTYEFSLAYRPPAGGSQVVTGIASFGGPGPVIFFEPRRATTVDAGGGVAASSGLPEVSGEHSTSPLTGNLVIHNLPAPDDRIEGAFAADFAGGARFAGVVTASDGTYRGDCHLVRRTRNASAAVLAGAYDVLGIAFSGASSANEVSTWTFDGAGGFLATGEVRTSADPATAARVSYSGSYAVAASGFLGATVTASSTPLVPAGLSLEGAIDPTGPQFFTLAAADAIGGIRRLVAVPAGAPPAGPEIEGTYRFAGVVIETANGAEVATPLLGGTVAVDVAGALVFDGSPAGWAAAAGAGYAVAYPTDRRSASAASVATRPGAPRALLALWRP